MEMQWKSGRGVRVKCDGRGGIGAMRRSVEWNLSEGSHCRMCVGTTGGCWVRMYAPNAGTPLTQVRP